MTNNFNNIKIKTIDKDISKDLSFILTKEKSEYLRYFIPFSFDEETIMKILAKAKLDKYFGIFINNNIVGFYMLRGFDKGYEIPSYGVYISEEYSGLGLSKLTLQHAISLCKLNCIKKLMLKVYHDNKIAKHVYVSFGFKKISTDKNDNNIIIYLKKIK